MKIVAMYLLLFSWIISCKEVSHYKYEDGIFLYYKKAFNIDLTELNERSYFYMIPIEGCEGCVFDNLSYLSKMNSSNLTIVFIGTNHNQQWDGLISKIKSEFSHLEDPQKIVYRYETGISKPLLIEVLNKRCTKGVTISNINSGVLEKHISER